MTDMEEAVAFHGRFQPREGVDYAWVVAIARERLAVSRATFKAIDDKAAHLMTYLGSGTGVVIAAAIAGVAAGPVHPLVAFSSLPAFVFALLSLTLAARCRGPHDLYPPPTAASAAQLADQGPLGEAAMISSWNLAAMGNDAATGRKAAQLTDAVRALVATVWLLLLPLAVGIGVRTYYGPPTPPAAGQSPKGTP